MGTLKYKQTILAHLLAGAASWQLKITDLTLSDTIESQILAENYVWMNMPHIKVNYKLLIMKTEFKKQLGKKKKKKNIHCEWNKTNYHEMPHKLGSKQVIPGTQEHSWPKGF